MRDSDPPRCAAHGEGGHAKKIEFTDEHRRIVENLGAVGFPLSRIAEGLGVSEQTLRRRFGEEWRRAKIRAKAKLADTLLGRAFSGDTTALIFACKTQLRLSTKVRLEHTGAGGGPIEVTGRLSDVIEDEDATIGDMLDAWRDAGGDGQ